MCWFLLGYGGEIFYGPIIDWPNGVNQVLETGCCSHTSLESSYMKIWIIFFEVSHITGKNIFKVQTVCSHSGILFQICLDKSVWSPRQKVTVLCPRTNELDSNFDADSMPKLCQNSALWIHLTLPAVSFSHDLYFPLCELIKCGRL